MSEAGIISTGLSWTWSRRRFALPGGFGRSVQGSKTAGAGHGLSGGIDSSVTAALAVNALGPDRVFGLLMPETAIGLRQRFL